MRRVHCGLVKLILGTCAACSLTEAPGAKCADTEDTDTRQQVKPRFAPHRFPFPWSFMSCICVCRYVIRSRPVDV